MKIKQIFKSKLLINYLSIPYFFYIFFVTIFGRTFNGLFIGQFRLGELVIGSSILLMIFILINFRKNLVDQTLLKLFFLLTIVFVISAVLSNSSFLDTYTYKSSSILWTLSFIYLGSLLFQSEYTDRFIKFLYIFSPLTYIFTIVFFPNPFFNFFVINSDKFDYLKSSDILLTYLLLNFLTKRYSNNEKFSYRFFIFSTAIIAPLLSFMSRGAFLSLILYCLFEIFYIKRFVIKNKLYSFVILLSATVFFALSTVIITTEIDFEFLNFGKKIEIVDENQNVLASGRTEVVRRQLPIVFVEREFFGTTLSIFYQDGRFYSTEVTANWRLQLWQDVIEDVNNKGRFFYGYGFSEIIPAMTNPDNNGNDSTNENLHNYFVQAFARGGIIYLLLLIFVIFTYLRIWIVTKGNYLILQFAVPVLVVSVFDPTLETVRFPLIYYSFLGYFLSDKKLYSDKKLID